jgi:hypothetical protein
MEFSGGVFGVRECWDCEFISRFLIRRVVNLGFCQDKVATGVL